MDLGNLSLLPSSLPSPPDGNRNPFQRGSILQRLLSSSCFPKNIADVTLSSLGAYAMAFDEVGPLRTARGW